MVTGLVVICGPTATGKSGLAIDLAERLNTVILSADSRACYREFDIGTAKPTATERQRVPHHLIDICDPTDNLTLADYQTQAQTLIAHYQAQPHAANVPPFLVGGTGLYIKAIVQGLKIPRVPPQPALRSQLADQGQPYLYACLQQIDPDAAQRIKPNDQVRTIRALEVYYTTGQTISALQGENPPTYPILQIGIDCAQPQALTQRIERRTRQMLADGLVAEVEQLSCRYGWELPLLRTLGYQEIGQALQGKISLEEAEALTVLHTRQFAKRQRTWFRADPRIQWFEADHPDLPSQVWKSIQHFCKFCENLPESQPDRLTK